MTLELKGLCCGYGRRTVMHDVSLALNAGENLCLLGPNGVGKTTLFRTILGLLKPLGGDVIVDGVSLARRSRRERARVLAYVPQAHDPPFPFRVLDVVITGRTSHIGITGVPSRRDEAVALESLARLGIEDLSRRCYTELSGGERQLVLIARALAQDAQVLIMDEPSANLDFGNQARLLALVRSLVQEQALSVLMSSHFPNHAFECASRVALISGGQVVALGAPNEVLTEASLEQIYGVPVSIIEDEPGSDSALRFCAARVN